MKRLKAYRRREERRPRSRRVPDVLVSGAQMAHAVPDVAASDLDIALYPSGILHEYFPLRERTEQE